jgi:glutamate-1-semialdehyde 2,1-aminomutase
MQAIAPLGPVYQAGTLSGNPVAVAAGLATLKLIQSPGFHDKLAASTRALCEGLIDCAQRSNLPFSAANVGGMFGVFFRETPPSSYAEVMQCDKEAFNRFFHAMLAEGIYFAPSAYEAGFVSSAHGAAEITRTINAAGKVFGEMRA